MTQYQPEDCHAHSITGTRGAEHLVKYCTVPVMYRYSYLFTLPVPGICNKKALFPLSTSPSFLIVNGGSHAGAGPTPLWGKRGGVLEYG